MVESIRWIYPAKIKKGKHRYEVKDTDWCIRVSINIRWSNLPAFTKALVEAYRKKGYSIDEIGLNVAFYLLNLKYKKPKTLAKEQDKNCFRYIRDWKKIAKARDKHLQLLQLFQ